MFELEEVATRRRRPIMLQLATMIDVFVLIIVFLIKGTVLSNVSITLPSEMKAAKSVSREGLEAAPQVVLFNNEVEIGFLKQKYSLDEFTESRPGFVKDLKAQVDAYISQAAEKNSLVNVNFVTDANTSYSQIYDVVKVLRKAGFQSILFIAQGEGTTQ